jgi:glucose-1-phosphate cytidylyltransferase
MKAVILAGGLGTRISEESVLRPKPMIEIGGMPIIWHIMKIYAHHGITDFIICAGYRGYVIKEYFQNYFLHQADVTFDMKQNSVRYHGSKAEPWLITVLDTGENTMTGGRLKRIGRHLAPNEPFCMTYGDGVADIDITALVAFHKRHGALATLTAVTPPGRYGALEMDSNDRNKVRRFTEKPPGDKARINGGFFVLQPSVLDQIAGDATPWESTPLESLARDGQLQAFDHDGFWQPMDTLRDKTQLEQHWASGRAPWKVWA